MRALQGVTLELHRHEVVGLIGPNGAGKSTLVNVITGFDLPTEGTVELAGRDVTGWSSHRRARAGLARTFQIARGLSGMSVLENLMLYGRDQPGETFARAVLPSRAARRREEELRGRAVEHDQAAEAQAQILDLEQVHGHSRARRLIRGFPRTPGRRAGLRRSGRD